MRFGIRECREGGGLELRRRTVGSGRAAPAPRAPGRQSALCAPEPQREGGDTRRPRPGCLPASWVGVSSPSWGPAQSPALRGSGNTRRMSLQQEASRSVPPEAPRPEKSAELGCLTPGRWGGGHGQSSCLHQTPGSRSGTGSCAHWLPGSGSWAPGGQPRAWAAATPRPQPPPATRRRARLQPAEPAHTPARLRFISHEPRAQRHPTTEL